jgi:hypothetical protein
MTCFKAWGSAAVAADPPAVADGEAGEAVGRAAPGFVSAAFRGDQGEAVQPDSKSPATAQVILNDGRPIGGSRWSK